MINFNYEIDFELQNELVYSNWLSQVILSENKEEGTIDYVFCDDDYLYKINMEYLNHDTFTDVISFDYSIENQLHGDIFISIERVKENADIYNVSFENELRRVMVHGILHYCGYKDKVESDENIMRVKEDEKLNMFHVEHI